MYSKNQLKPGVDLPVQVACSLLAYLFLSVMGYAAIHEEASESHVQQPDTPQTFQHRRGASSKHGVELSLPEQEHRFKSQIGRSDA